MIAVFKPGSSWSSSYRVAEPGAATRGTRYQYTFTASEAFNRIMICGSNNTSHSAGITSTIVNPQLETGSVMTPYLPPVTATDFIARLTTPLESTNDTTDRTKEILNALSSNGYCELGKGTFYTKGLKMPDGTTLKGLGNESVLMLDSSVSVPAITLGSRCEVDSLDIVGASSNIELTGEAVGIDRTEDTTSTNLWEDGDRSITESAGYTHVVLTNPLPAGMYKVSALVSKTGSTTECLIAFSTSLVHII